MYKGRKWLATILVLLMICSFETGLAGTYVLPSSVTTLDSEAFSGNTSLTEVTLNSGVTSIGSKCFYGCKNLYQINIPSSVTSIGTNCFTGCLSEMLIQTTPGSYAMKWARNNHFDFQADTTYRAVLIGQMYEDEDSYLGYAPKHDALVTAQCLKNAEGTPFDVHCWVDLTASEILGAIDYVFGDAQDQDVSFFFYSGHGVGDSDPAWNGALCGTQNTYIKVSQLRQKLDTIKGRKIIVIDACHSGQLIESESGSMTRSKEKSSTAAASFANAFISAFSSQSRATDDYNRYYILTAAAADEVSMTSSVNNVAISVFTHFFTQGLGYDMANTSYVGNLLADTNSSGSVSIREAYEYVQRCTSDNDVQTVQVFPSGCNWMSIVRSR